MSRLWVPPKVSRELREQSDEFQAQVLGMVGRFHGVMKHWTDRAREIDPRLECIFAPPSQKSEEAGMVPGRYHWLRVSDPGVPPTIIPIEHPDTGGFTEPTEWHLEQLRAGDLQNPRAVRDRQRVEMEAKHAEERTKEREREERWEELRDRAKAAWATSVSMTDARRWTQNMDAKVPKRKKAA